MRYLPTFLVALLLAAVLAGCASARVPAPPATYAVDLRPADTPNAIPLLPMVMQLVIGASLLVM